MKVHNNETSLVNKIEAKNKQGAVTYRAFHRFGQAKFPDDGLVLGSNLFSMLPQLHPKIVLDSKVVKINPKNHLDSLI